jgi:two-component system, OmpR family, phosphate regulon sensor histidine kinase PhoR
MEMPIDAAAELGHQDAFYALLLAIAGHDLRNQLQKIISAHRSLDRYIGHGPGRKCFEHCESATAELVGQLNMILGAVRIYHKHTIVRGPVPLRLLFLGIGREFAESAVRNDIRLQIQSTDAVVLSDACLLASILRNFTQNAIKYTGAGGEVTVECRQCGPLARLEVNDSGIGIEREHLTKVFEAFQRLDAHSGEGLGLGLFLAKQAAGLLSHRLEARSAPGRGSSFVVVAELVAEAGT